MCTRWLWLLLLLLLVLLLLVEGAGPVLATDWKADCLEPILVGRGGGEPSLLAGCSMKSYHRSLSALCPLQLEVSVELCCCYWSSPPCCSWPAGAAGAAVLPAPSCGSMKLLLLEPVP